MSASRDISLNIGKGIYAITTPLSGEELDRVKALINEACDPVTKGAKQEEVLMLACLRLAYSLDRVAQELAGVMGKLEGS